jgi:hypothetical protein
VFIGQKIYFTVPLGKNENTELLKAMKEMMNKMKNAKEDVNANRKADREHMQEIRTNPERMEAKMKETMETQLGSLAAKVDAWRKEMQVDREARKTTDLKANPASKGGPQGTCCGETCRRTEEAAEMPESRCRAPRAAKGTDPRRLRISEEVRYRLQEGVPPCKSGMAQEEQCEEEEEEWSPRKKKIHTHTHTQEETPSHKKTPRIGIPGKERTVIHR